MRKGWALSDRRLKIKLFGLSRIGGGQRFFHTFEALGKAALTCLLAPLPRWGGRGEGVRVGGANPRLAPWATMYPALGGLNS